MMAEEFRGFLFRLIRQEEAEQAVEIETVCFPPGQGDGSCVQFLFGED